MNTQTGKENSMTDHFDMPDQPQSSPWRPTAIPGPLDAIQKALENGALPETLERMMALQERYEAAQARAAFLTAFAAARAELKPILKANQVGYDSVKGGARTEYAFEDLATIAEQVDPILAQHGLSYWFEPKQDGMMLTITCVLDHVQGHSRRASLTGGNDSSGNKNPMQALGSACTYLERYTLRAVLGLAAAKDDDAQSSGKGNGAARTIDMAQYEELMALMEQAGSTEKQVLYVAMAEGQAIETLTQKQYRDAKAALLRKIEKAKGAPK